MSELEIISFEKDTKRINDEIKQKIANHLWMFCGYKDSILPAMNFNAKYIKAIFDLYNVIIDSSLVTRLYGQNGIAPKKQKNAKQIKCISETINMLRTVGCHTISEENIREEISLKFKEWQFEHCGNNNPTENEDFEKLIKGLLDLESKCFNLLDDFMKDALNLNSNLKDEMVEKWEDAIIEHYFKTTNQNMFENKLIEWYKMKQPNGSYQINKIGTYNAINNLIMYEIYLKERKNIYQLMQAKETGKFTSDDLDSIDQAINEYQLSIDGKKMEVANFVGKANKIQDLIPSDYRKHFFSKEILGKKMRDSINGIKSENLTLLPQDLFGYIIKNEFNM